jgi:hypothetical protein
MKAIERQLEQLQGREFDWFAVDGDGNIAMFATAGEGFVPEEVIRHLSQHDSLSEEIPAPHTGTTQVFNDYAALGLYVFDWDLPSGSYVLQASPSKPIARGFHRKVRSISQLPVYDGSFSRLSKLSSWPVT